MILWNDIKFSVRQLCKNPGFTAVAVITLALCIGANVTIFAVVDAILMRPLPYPEADRLVTAIKCYPGAGVERSGVSIINCYDYQKEIKAFESCAIIRSSNVYDNSVIVGDAGSPRRVQCDFVSSKFFETLKVPLFLGRSFTEEEVIEQADDVVVITYAYWHNYFDADPNVLGRTLQIDARQRTVIGVLPSNFRYLSSRAQIYAPISSNPNLRNDPIHRHNNDYELIARLAPGANLTEAQAQIDALDEIQTKNDPRADIFNKAGFNTRVQSLHEDHVQTIKSILLLIQCGALILLLIGSVNLINLLLIRAGSRVKELAIRRSMGASWRHVVSQKFVETVLLTLIGGLCGLVVGAGGIHFLARLGVNQLPLGMHIVFDHRLVVIALLGAITIGIVMALPITWLSLKSRLAQALRSETRGGISNRSAQRLHFSFVVTQIALTFVLLVGAGLLTLSLKNAITVSPGFQVDHMLTGHINLPGTKYRLPSERLEFIERLIPAIKAQPGVIHVGINTMIPFGHYQPDGGIAFEGHDTVSGNSIRTHYRSGVAGDYFNAMGIPLIEGRFLDDADNQRQERLCVVDENIARYYWPDESALGRRLSHGGVFNEKNAYTIIGVVGAVKQKYLTDITAKGAVYFPYKRFSWPRFYVTVRTVVDPASFASTLRKTVLQVDPQMPIDDLKRMQNRISESLVIQRTPALLTGVFAGVALLLAAVGTYGVLAYAVSQQYREIGVRLALGALPRQVLVQFLNLGLRQLIIGMSLGLFGAWALGRVMQSVLFDVPVFHVAILIMSAIIMSIVTFIACYIPARRAARIDPMGALRYE